MFHTNLLIFAGLLLDAQCASIYVRLEAQDARNQSQLQLNATEGISMIVQSKNPSIHIVADPDEGHHTGFNNQGKIDNATWSVKSKTGAIAFDSQHELIHIETAGVYHVYGQLEYMSSNNNTREVMGHCIVSGQNTTTLQPEQCAKISPHNRIHHQHRHNYTWFNHGTKYVSGTFALAENSYVGIRLEFNPAANRDFVLFRPIGCYFGAFKVA